MKFKINVEELMKVQFENVGLQKLQKDKFEHFGKQIETDNLDGISSVALDFIRSVKLNNQPFVDVNQFVIDQEIKEVDNLTTLTENAKAHYAQPKNFMQRLANSFPKWAEPIVKAHTQTVFGLVTNVAMTGLRQQVEGRPSILIKQPKLGDLSANLIEDNDRMFLKVTVNQLPIQSMASTEIVGYIPGPAEATYEIFNQDGKWGYKLIGEVETENEHLNRMLHGELISEKEIEITYCYPYMLSKQCEKYRDTVARNFVSTRDNFLIALDQIYASESLGKDDPILKGLDKKDIGDILRFRKDLNQAIKDNKKEGNPHAVIKALSDIIFELNASNPRVLKMLLKNKLLSDPMIKEILKFSMLENLSKPMPSADFAKRFDQLSNLLSGKNPEDKQFMSEITNIMKQSRESELSLNPKKESSWSLWKKEGQKPASPKDKTPPRQQHQ